MTKYSKSHKNNPELDKAFRRGRREGLKDMQIELTKRIREVKGVGPKNEEVFLKLFHDVYHELEYGKKDES